MNRFATATLQPSVVEVLKLMQTKLHVLSRQQSAIGKRIRTIHLVLHGLQEGVGQSAADGLYAERPVITEQQREQARGVCCNRVTAPYGDLRRSRVPGKDESDYPYWRLKRACRIALLEIGRAASAEEIHSHIVRRGSFSFVHSTHDRDSIVHALTAMIQEGEIRRVDDGTVWRWVRVSSEETSQGC